MTIQNGLIRLRKIKQMVLIIYMTPRLKMTCNDKSNTEFNRVIH